MTIFPRFKFNFTHLLSYTRINVLLKYVNSKKNTFNISSIRQNLIYNIYSCKVQGIDQIQRYVFSNTIIFICLMVFCIDKYCLEIDHRNTLSFRFHIECKVNIVIGDIPVFNLQTNCFVPIYVF